MDSGSATTTAAPLGHKDKLVVIIGATGAGKSRLSIDLATHFPSCFEVINSDKNSGLQGTRHHHQQDSISRPPWSSPPPPRPVRSARWGAHPSRVSTTRRSSRFRHYFSAESARACRWVQLSSTRPPRRPVRTGCRCLPRLRRHIVGAQSAKNRQGDINPEKAAIVPELRRYGGAALEDIYTRFEPVDMEGVY
ncbi:hypothetical protein M0R45_037854 [Rubus argutus]|uniref:Uncharacterized protein n=1 Tax=Rubus argutus TaxID=59490 RepID=A0AAW1W1Q1_RUBAR